MFLPRKSYFLPYFEPQVQTLSRWRCSGQVQSSVGLTFGSNRNQIARTGPTVDWREWPCIARYILLLPYITIYYYYILPYMTMNIVCYHSYHILPYIPYIKTETIFCIITMYKRDLLKFWMEVWSLDVQRQRRLELDVCFNLNFRRTRVG